LRLFPTTAFLENRGGGRGGGGWFTVRGKGHVRASLKKGKKTQPSGERGEAHLCKGESQGHEFKEERKKNQSIHLHGRRGGRKSTLLTTTKKTGPSSSEREEDLGRPERKGGHHKSAHQQRGTRPAYREGTGKGKPSKRKKTGTIAW